MSNRTKTYLLLNANIPASGQAPVVITWLTTAGGVPTSAAPTISEINTTGIYTYEVPADLVEDVVMIIDSDPGGTTGLSAADRYQFVYLQPSDYGLSSGLKVTWAEAHSVRNISDVEDALDVIVFVRLVDRQGNPIQGVVAADVGTIVISMLQEANDLTNNTLDPLTASWGELAGLSGIPADAFAGLYYFRIPGATFGGNQHWTVDLHLTADPDHHYNFIVDDNAGTGGGDDGQGVLLMGMVALTGYNGVYRFTSYTAEGEPLAGQYLIYSDAEGAAAEDPLKLVCAIDLAYAYDGQGRLVTLKKTIDAMNLLLFITFLRGGG